MKTHLYLLAAAIVVDLLPTLASGQPIEWANGGYGNEVYGLAYSLDGRWLATGSRDRSIKVWRVPDGARALTIANAHTGLGTWRMAFSPDGSLLASTGSDDGMIKFWRPSDGQLIRTIALDPGVTTAEDLAFSPDGLYLACPGRGYGEQWPLRYPH